MNNKRTWIEKFGDFISGKGFYLVVLICVAAIALSGYYLVQGVRTGLGEADQPVSGSAAIADQPSARPSVKPSAPPASQVPRVTAPPSAAVSASPSPQPTPSPQPSAAPSVPPTLAPAPLVFTWPVKGTVIAGLAVETLAYNETMGDWRTHEGLDIAAPLGTQVLAIDHGEGLMSRYANLAEAPTVKVGDGVTTGAVIGSVGETAASESGREPHIHYALLKNGWPVDPTGYLPPQ